MTVLAALFSQGAAAKEIPVPQDEGIPGLCEGVGACNRPWITSGNADWLFQTAVSHDGWNAVQSGDVYDNQSSTLQTMVTGPVSVSFWWKVSSEVDYDVLSFSVNGTLTHQTSGEVDWTKETVSLDAGSNLLTWVYTKDSGLSIGADAGWVDQFLVVEAVPPTGSVAVNGGDARTPSADVTLSLTYDDGDGSGVSGMRFSNNGSTWSSWEKPAAAKAWALSPGDGVKTVRAQFRDKAGNVSAIAGDYIAVDTTAPTGGMVINGGQSATQDPNVTLTLAWDDGDGFGVSRMRFSNDGATWSPWEPVAATKAWALAGATPGHYTVRVQYRDRAGLVSDRFSDFIRLDP
ncbi:MAG: hypothetical protein GXY15_14865 [Candidatus Hydrogenedentes bacterium]|nr:hypothetical protein [Candidatus Hydrogenedentota bacterium]